jgi:signal transduction histidine kinase
MERRYENIEVVDRCQKSSPASIKRAVRKKAPLRSVIRETPHKKSEHKPQETGWPASVGARAAIFAHEVGNPLAGILLSLKYVEIQLEKQEANDPSLLSVIQGAIGEIDRLGSLLNEFRSLALEQTLNLRCADLPKVVEEVLTLEMIAYRAAGVTIKFAVEDALPPVRLDTKKIKQVILNLCKNAVEAMPDGGFLKLKCYRSRGMVILEISDDGVGVPDDINIFELYKTTKPGGMGLGLPLVQHIISAHNGTIAYKSAPGRGATFKISLAHI